ncbi:MAG: ribonuclease P protein component [Patescibacteria group bacterium]
MLSKKNRVSKKKVDELFKDGFFISSSNLSFKFLLKKTGFKPRISFICPKAINKKAVIRNKLRRMGYKIIKKHIKQFPACLTGVFVFSKNSLDFLKKPKKTYLLNLENEILFILDRLNSNTNAKKKVKIFLFI